jgi:hypothetical protein
MATLFPVAGSKIYIGNAALASESGDMVPSDFTAVTWVEIDGWINAGAIGDTSETISTRLINRNRTIKQKGSRDAGSMENEFAALTADAGQLALIAAEKTSSEYPFKIEWDDADVVELPDTSTPTTFLFCALVNGARYGQGTANTIHTLNSTLEINSNIVVVAKAVVEG